MEFISMNDVVVINILKADEDKTKKCSDIIIEHLKSEGFKLAHVKIQTKDDTLIFSFTGKGFIVINGAIIVNDVGMINQMFYEKLSKEYSCLITLNFENSQTQPDMFFTKGKLEFMIGNSKQSDSIDAKLLKGEH